MSNQELVDHGMKTMDETDQAIERSKKVVEQTIEVGTQTAGTLKGQTDQMGRIVNELDTIQFSIKKASQLVKEIGRQVATDKCIMLFLFLIVCGVIAIIVVKVFFSLTDFNFRYRCSLNNVCDGTMQNFHFLIACGKISDCESEQQRYQRYSRIGTSSTFEEIVISKRPAVKR
ncbi:putative plant SNARE 13 [Gossypium australe]|uniref:Putative plant SNARE 13 n=1 Tax=Gossypium australe TaxID=47621 RepID=A0A5B6WWA1_9ROSI|nr:putative plant SNARE 13 [Gossypium australe]